MHPQLRHVPPRFSFSTQRTFFFSCPARIAAAYPAGPPPMTRMSNWYLPGELVAADAFEGDGDAAGFACAAGAGVGLDIGVEPVGCFGAAAGVVAGAGAAAV